MKDRRSNPTGSGAIIALLILAGTIGGGLLGLVVLTKLVVQVHQSKLHACGLDRVSRSGEDTEDGEASPGEDDPSDEVFCVSSGTSLTS